jgi:peptidyl-prolyl cis-trans isomerase B (cyclophilin B)
MNPIVTFEMENGNTFTAELYPDVAPNTVANFVTLVQSGFYDGLIFHRVIPGFMIQGGDPTGTGTGGPGYRIRGEFSANGVPNALRHTRGVLSMARSMMKDSAGSQFFVMHADAPHLDGQYAAFGKVTGGLETVDAIAAARTGAQDRPVADQRILKATVDTRGQAYTVQKM